MKISKPQVKESSKNVIIAILVVMQVAFIAGIKYEQQRTNDFKLEVQKQVDQSLKDQSQQPKQ